MSRSWLPLLLVFAAGVGVGWWLAPRAEPATEAVTNAAASAAEASVAPAPASIPAPDTSLPILTPQERQAYEAQEVERSAAAEPPRAYRGIDGKPRAFRYPDPVSAESAERTRQARREQLMRELEADPARFARDHKLSLKQVQWIADGETDFPDELLEP
jgi:hypothetical protein